MAKPRPVDEPIHPNEDLEFEGCNIHPSATESGPITKSRKSSKKPSPYQQRQVIINHGGVDGGKEIQDVTGDDLRARARHRSSVSQSILADALRRRHGIHRAEPEKDGIVTKIVDRFRTKKVSGVTVVGAKKIEVTKLTEKQLRNEDGIKENLEMMEEFGDRLEDLL